ncbi:mitochondrial carrier domain-containing protein [Pseudomassariella vexata]|uniref:Mitochondrial carrier domain-containing protein n=1 Tax=Pseudomassariella vexata TaxID=1141098 RepID=A0A1Y2DSZ7_9PEZI|nr:mitochondrial carrier domain-containing protein [Pseudomassariella vexata]ORY62390.1 mitochondrial carrier domain-containing protein [Pseudomassariella vexata]
MSGSSNADVLLAGAAAAFTVDLLVYPLDTLKTRQQSRDFLKTFANPASKTKVPSRELFRGLYQGIGIVVVATLPAAGTFFTTYEAAKGFFGRHGAAVGLPQPIVHSAASAVAECASCFVLTPAEVIKQNAQMFTRKVGGDQSSTSMRALRQLGGPGAGRKLLSGYTAMVARNLPFTAIQFPIFEYTRKRVWGRRGKAGIGYGTGENQNLLETGIITGTSAGMAGSFAAVVTTPMDVVKTRMMLMAGDEQGFRQGAHDRTAAGNKHWSRGRSGLDVTKQVIKERGVPGLFRGSLLRAVWTAIGSGLYLGMYEVSKVWLARGKSVERGGFP